MRSPLTGGRSPIQLYTAPSVTIDRRESRWPRFSGVAVSADRFGRFARLGEPDAEVGQRGGTAAAVALELAVGQLPADPGGFLGDR